MSFKGTRKPNRPSQSPKHQASISPSATKVIGKSRAPIWLAVTAGPDTGRTVQLGGGDNFIGREQQNGLVLNDSYVSGRHALLRVVDGNSYVYDVGSKGGTKVNGKSIGGHNIGPNSVIRLGETELSLVQVDGVEHAFVWDAGQSVIPPGADVLLRLRVADDFNRAWEKQVIIVEQGPTDQGIGANLSQFALPQPYMAGDGARPRRVDWSSC